jgi:peptidyl-prolyl cis-trans isomerase B (cyclophilin B)
MAEPNPVVSMQTNVGEIVLELFEDAAPNTVANFIQLAEKGFYANKNFHRIIKDFMIQGGCPQGTGTGGPGYRFADECKGNPYRVDRYTLCMANAGPNTNGSQFFIVTKTDGCDWLTGKHTVFGKVIKGTDVVDKLGNCRTSAGDRPNPEMKITSVTVVSKRNHPYAVKPL